MGERVRNLIDGKWIESVNGTTFDDINPANKTEVLGTFPRSDHRDVDRAVEAAAKHLEGWSKAAPMRRAEVLYRAACLIEQQTEAFTGLIVREAGKTLLEAELELREGIGLLRAIAGDGARRGTIMMPAEHAEAIAMALPVPLGVVAAITHWGFPLSGCIRGLASALAVGSTVVLKPAEDAPLTATRLVEVLLEGGLPAGTVNLVHGQGEEAGAPLVRHPDVALVCFAGSSDVGREVAIACAAEHKRCCLDLGEQHLVIVLEDADIDLAVDGAAESGLAMAGQRWRGAVPVFVPRKMTKEVSERMTARLQSVHVGDGLAISTTMGPLISESQLKRVHSQTRLAVRDGARLLTGGEVVKDGECKRGFFYAPTVFSDATCAMRLVQDEVLGPTLAVVTAGAEEAMAYMNTIRRNSVATLYTRDMDRALRLIQPLRNGRVYINPTPAKAGARLSLAGANELGRIHREGVAGSLDVFTAWKETIFEAVAKR